MEINSAFLFIVPLVVALVEAAKFSRLPNQFAPLLSLALGIGLTSLVSGGLDLLQGLVVGLSASGLYSGARATLNR